MGGGEFLLLAPGQAAEGKHVGGSVTDDNECADQRRRGRAVQRRRGSEGDLGRGVGGGVRAARATVWAGSGLGFRLLVPLVLGEHEPAPRGHRERALDPGAAQVLRPS